MSVVMSNQLIQISENQTGIFSYFYVSYYNTSNRRKMEYTLNPIQFNSMEDALKHSAKYFAKFAIQTSDELNFFTIDELTDEYYSQFMENDCQTLYDFLKDCTDYFKGYTLLEVNEKSTLKSLKEYAKMCFIKGYNTLEKKDLIYKINNYKLAIKTS